MLDGLLFGPGLLVLLVDIEVVGVDDHLLFVCAGLGPFQECFGLFLVDFAFLEKVFDALVVKFILFGRGIGLGDEFRVRGSPLGGSR